MWRRARFSHPPILESSLDPSLLQPQSNWVAHVDHLPGQCECGKTLKLILSDQPCEQQSGPRLGVSVMLGSAFLEVQRAGVSQGRGARARPRENDRVGQAPIRPIR
jgi:hypothetical protein